MGKSKKRAARWKNAQAGSDSAEEEKKEHPRMTSDDEDVDMEDLDPDFDNLPNDGSPAVRRHKPARIDDWAQEIIQNLVEKSGQDIKMELHSETPDFSKVEKHFKKANQKIQKANREHNVSMEHNLINEKQYQINYDSWSALINTDMVRGSPEKGWKAYDGLCGALSMFNHGNNLPDDWNIPPDATIRIFGEQPNHMEKSHPTEEVDSAVEYSEESESESEESSEEYGINTLESKMRKEYTTLSHGKALYWWRISTGTQIFVRYGSKKNPIYQVMQDHQSPTTSKQQNWF